MAQSRATAVAVRRPRLGPHRGHLVRQVDDEHRPTRRAAGAAGAIAEVVGAIARQPSRFDALSLQETYSEFGATDAAVDAALARLAAVWDDARALDTDLEQAANESKQARAPDIDS